MVCGPTKTRKERDMKNYYSYEGTIWSTVISFTAILSTTSSGFSGTTRSAWMSPSSPWSASVGNEEMQVAFYIQEMREDFPNVWRVLTSSWDLYECTRIVYIQYERPAVNNVDARFAFARQFMEQFPDEPEDTGSSQESGESDLAVAMLQLLMREGGCWDRELDGVKSPAFREKIREYADDVASC